MKMATIELAKFRRLTRRLRPLLGGSPVAPETIVVGLLERLWSVTARNARDGAVGRLANEDLAELVGWLGEPPDLIAALVECGWLDEHPVHRLVVHDWPDHCPGWVTAAVRRDYLGGRGGWADEAVPTDWGPPSKSGLETRLVSAHESEPVSGHESRNKGALPSLTPPSPSPSPPPQPGAAGGEGEWEGIIAELEGHGMRLARDVVPHVAEAGCSAADVRAHVAQWLIRRDGWASPVGVLHARLRRLRPGEDPIAEWPPADDSSDRARRRAAESRRAAEQAAAYREGRAAAEAARRLRGEQRPRLRALSEADRARLLEQAIPDPAVRLRAGPTIAEESCLDYLARHSGHALAVGEGEGYTPL